MPIGFSDLLKTTAQLDNNLTKGIVSTDDTYGGVRSKIDDWTDLHLSTYNNGSGYTFQDDGTSTAPGHFKEYSTMFYVADGRALVQNDSAAGTYITLDPATGEYDPSGTKFEVPSGTAEPEFWVLDDATQIGGTGSGTDKLPKFTIGGTSGSYTAIPAGYQKLQVLTNAVAGNDSVVTDAILDSDFTSSGLMTTDGSGNYSVTTNNASNWDTAYGWGDHGSAGYLTSETSHADVLVDGDFASAGIMATNGSGSYSIVTNNSTNWDTAYGWGDHGSAGYLTSETSHADVLVDGDFASAGIMATDGSGSYSIVTNNSTNWDTAYGWGDHGSAGYLTSETSHADVLVDGDFASAGIMATDGSGSYSIVTNNSTNWDTAYGWGDHGSAGYLTSETSHADVLVDSDFGSAGIMATDGSGSYSIVTNNSTNWDTAYGWGDHGSAGYVETSHTGNVSITGDLTVSGAFISANSTAVNFEDAVLQLAVPRGVDNAITAEDGTTAVDSGLDFVKVTTAGSIDEWASLRYDVSADVFKFTRHADAGNWSEAQIISGADNVKALKFDVTTSNLAVEADATEAGTNDVADLYGTNSLARSNASNVRSLGGVSKCTIDITTEANNDTENYAPVTAASQGYPIQHDLGTSSVFVFALKTHKAGASGTGGAATQISEPEPVFCKFRVISDDIVEVKVGITIENEKYDIIVIG